MSSTTPMTLTTPTTAAYAGDPFAGIRAGRTALMTLAAVALAASTAALAQAWPAKPVRLILPYGPGGGSDVVARPLGHHLSQRVGQQFLVDNRGGANGNIAMEMVARAPADGYTLGLALPAQLAINPFLYTKIPYDPVRDFAPVSLLGSAPYFLTVSRGTPATSVEEFIRLARSKPGAMTYGSTGNGSGLHLSMELLKSMTGIDIVHAPYKSAGAAMTDLLGEQLQAMFVSYGAGGPVYFCTALWPDFTHAARSGIAANLRLGPSPNQGFDIGGVPVSRCRHV